MNKEQALIGLANFFSYETLEDCIFIVWSPIHFKNLESSRSIIHSYIKISLECYVKLDSS